MKMKSLSVAPLLLVSILAIGCDMNQASSGPFGAPQTSPLLEPFAGNWKFDLEKTFAAQQEAGATDEQIEQTRKFFADNPSIAQLNQDLEFTGNVAVGKGLLSSEYRFFQMHQHGTQLCGKAWHHEDRYDPGDMSKCFVRLELIDDDLHMRVNMLDEPIDLSDPDLNDAATVDGDPAQCEADKALEEDWAICVYSRQS